MAEHPMNTIGRQVQHPLLKRKHRSSTCSQLCRRWEADPPGLDRLVRSSSGVPSIGRNKVTLVAVALV